MAPNFCSRAPIEVANHNSNVRSCEQIVQGLLYIRTTPFWVAVVQQSLISLKNIVIAKSDAVQKCFISVKNLHVVQFFFRKRCRSFWQKNKPVVQFIFYGLVILFIGHDISRDRHESSPGRVMLEHFILSSRLYRQ